MEDKLIDLIYENNIRLVEYILQQIEDQYGQNHQEEQEIDINTAIQNDKDWIPDDIIDIELAIQQDKTWNMIINNDIQELINQDKEWEDN